MVLTPKNIRVNRFARSGMAVVIRLLRREPVLCVSCRDLQRHAPRLLLRNRKISRTSRTSLDAQPHACRRAFLWPQLWDSKRPILAGYHWYHVITVPMTACGAIAPSPSKSDNHNIQLDEFAWQKGSVHHCGSLLIFTVHQGYLRRVQISDWSDGRGRRPVR